MRGKASARSYRDIAIEAMSEVYVGAELTGRRLARLVDLKADEYDRRRKARVKKGAKNYGWKRERSCDAGKREGTD